MKWGGVGVIARFATIRRGGLRGNQGPFLLCLNMGTMWGQNRDL